MSPKSSSARKPAEQAVKDIRRATRRHFLAEDKIRIVLEGLRGGNGMTELCRKEGFARSRTALGAARFDHGGASHERAVFFVGRARIRFA